MGRAMLCYGVGGFAVTRISASPRQRNSSPASPCAGLFLKIKKPTLRLGVEFGGFAASHGKPITMDRPNLAPLRRGFFCPGVGNQSPAIPVVAGAC